MTPSEAAVYETFVVPRYDACLAAPLLDLVVAAGSADVAHLRCRTGHPDRELAERVGGGALWGFDGSPAALELARTKGAFVASMRVAYQVHAAGPVPLRDASVTHALTLHPPTLAEERRALLRDMERIVVPRGQVLLALPARGSFQELVDLLREYALKHAAPAVAEAADALAATRPTIDQLAEELEEAGLEHVDVEVRPTAIRLESGRALLEDPLARLVLLPEIARASSVDLASALRYAAEAADRYWSDGGFELSLHVACATARRR